MIAMTPGRRTWTVAAVALVGALVLLYVDRTYRARAGRSGVRSEEPRLEESAADDQQALAVEPPIGADVSSSVQERRIEEPTRAVPAGVLEVSVTSQEGAAIGGAEVTLVARDSRAAPTGIPQVRTTDENGEVVFSGLLPSAYRLAFSHPDYAPLVRITGVPTNRGTHLAVTLESGAELDVRVTGPRGEPVAGQEIVVTQHEEPPRRARTSVEGLTVFHHLKTTHGCYIEVAGAPGGANIEVTLPRGGTRTVEFRLGSQVTGLVVGPDDRPLAGVTVEVSRSGQYHRAKTDPAGRYRIDGLSPGPASVGVRLEGDGGFQTPALPLAILEGTTEHDIHIGRGELAGVVTHARTGTPLPHIGIYLARMVPPVSGVDLWLYTGSDGRFSARGLPPGRYRLYCGGSAAFREKEIFLDLAEGTAEDDVEIALEPKRCGTLRIRVVTADGRPPHDLSIGVTDTRPSGGSGDPQVASSSLTTLRPTQRTEGVYEVELDAGQHAIRVYTQSGLRAQFEVQIDEGRTSERIVDLR